MARQIAGRYKVNAPQIVPLYQEACRLLSRFEKASVVHVLRGKNALADKLANQGVAAGKKPQTKAQGSLTLNRPAGEPAASSRSRSGGTGGVHSSGSRASLIEMAKDLPVRKMPLSALGQLLDTEVWLDVKTGTIRTVADHAKQIYEADMTRPIILAADGSLIEGCFQIACAYLTGQKEVDVVQFETD